jgi:hypothetical protein
MSSHREAPEIAQDPVADSTDLYAFVSPDAPNMVTILANYVPLQNPAGGPNFFEFGDDVLYQIHIDNDGDGRPNISYQFKFSTRIEVGGTFLYNVGPITSLNASTWNRRQFYTVIRVNHQKGKKPTYTTLATNVPCPPCNIGPRSTPNYATLANAAITSLPGGGRVFAGQRAEGFYVDLGSIFDLGALRPIQNLHLIPLASAAAVNATKDLNVHSIALQLPKSAVTSNGHNPTDVKDTAAVIGVWTTASRSRVHFLRHEHGGKEHVGPWTQVSRLGNPLFNEVLVPMERKDEWNADRPSRDSEYASGVLHPELAKLLPVLYPGAFPHLKALTDSGKPRADLAAVLLTGVPGGLIPGFQTFTGTTQADLLRLNLAIPPASSPNNLGVLGGDLAGFPNGRRVADDIVTIELRAIAGATYPLIDHSFTPDGAVNAVNQGITVHASDYLPTFPYLAHPHSGFEVPAA